MLLSGGVKLYMDGSGGGRTAWVYDPWFKKAREVDTGNTGYPNIDPPVYREMVKTISRRRNSCKHACRG